MYFIALPNVRAYNMTMKYMRIFFKQESPEGGAWTDLGTSESVTDTAVQDRVDIPEALQDTPIRENTFDHKTPLISELNPLGSRGLLPETSTGVIEGKNEAESLTLNLDLNDTAQVTSSLEDSASITANSYEQVANKDLLSFARAESPNNTRSAEVVPPPLPGAEVRDAKNKEDALARVKEALKDATETPEEKNELPPPIPSEETATVVAPVVQIIEGKQEEPKEKKGILIKVLKGLGWFLKVSGMLLAAAVLAIYEGVASAFKTLKTGKITNNKEN